MGIDARIVNVGGEALSIFGVVDLCVRSKRRREGIASALLKKVEELAHKRDFLVLMADDDRLYCRHGYYRVTPARTCWLAIEDRTSYGLIERDLSDCFMVKPLSNRHWPSGRIDLLGYLF